MTVAGAATALSLFCSVLAAYAIARLRFRGADTVGLLIFLAYLVPPSILFIPLATMIFQFGLYDSMWALILTYPTRSEEHTSELQSLMRISYAVFCLKKKQKKQNQTLRTTKSTNN